MKVSNEAKVGAITAIAITLLILGFNFLKGKDILSSSNIYYAIYDQSEGLIPSNPVVLNGLPIGKVTNMEMDYSRNNSIVVKVEIDENIKVTKGSILKITNKDLVGSKAIQLILNDTNLLADLGDTLLAERDPGIEEGITKVLKPLSEKVNKLLADVDNTLGETDLQSTLVELNKTLISFRNSSETINAVVKTKDAQLNQSIANINKFTADLNTLVPDIKQSINKINTAGDKLNALEVQKVINDLGSATEKLSLVADNINEGKGSLGQLATNRELYDNINKAAKDLDALILDIEKYPKRYLSVFGGKKADKKRTEDIESGEYQR